VEDVWETIEVYTQRNQMSICLQRYDVRAAQLRWMLGRYLSTQFFDCGTGYVCRTW
jgi:hypothetical protein